MNTWLKFFFFWLVIVLPTFNFAQGFPVYHPDSIRLQVNAFNGPYYYPTLIKRFHQGDTTLGAYHHYLLYHGLPFQSHYNPYGSKSDEMRKLMKEESYKKALKLCQSVLAKNPADLDANYFSYIALKKTGKEEAAAEILLHYEAFLESVLSTGSGNSMESAFRVNTVNDEYKVLSYLGLEFKSQGLVPDGNGNFYDRIEVKPSVHYKEKEVYFDITRAFTRLGKMLKETE